MRLMWLQHDVYALMKPAILRMKIRLLTITGIILGGAIGQMAPLPSKMAPHFYADGPFI
jgi:hypothetical protein